MALASLTQLIAVYGLDNADDREETALQLALDSAIEMVINHCGRTFAPIDVTPTVRTYEGATSMVLIVRSTEF